MVEYVERTLELHEICRFLSVSHFGRWKFYDVVMPDASHSLSLYFLGLIELDNVVEADCMTETSTAAGSQL